VSDSSPERISDPLSAGEPDGGVRARARLRLAGALLFAAGAVTLVTVLLAPDPDTSDHAALAACGGAYAAVALVLALWRRPPDLVLHAICPLGTVATTAALAFAEPVGLVPIFYLWPILVAAYFLSREEVGANFAFAAVCCGVTLALWVDPELRSATFMVVMAMVGVVTSVILSLRGQVRRLVLRLGDLATHDFLTGALNRGAFEQRLEAELARTDRAGSPCALVVFDVDHFKRINDSFGHAAGDQALRDLSRVVEAAKRRSDVFGRIGGEEFAVLLPDTDAEGASTFARHLRMRLADEAATERPMTVSLGVTDDVTGGASVRDMLHSADRALYAAKRGGRDQVVCADELREGPAGVHPRAWLPPIGTAARRGASPPRG
jgi:diguanylate cyclase (GGDEF)-like protein